MYPALSLAVAMFLGVVAVLAVVGIFVSRLEELARLAMKVGQFATLVVVGLDVITMLQGHEPPNRTTHIGYAVAAVGLPVLLLTRHATGEEHEGQEDHDEREQEQPRAHLGVVAVTAAAMVVLVIRLQQTW